MISTIPSSDPQSGIVRKPLRIFYGWWVVATAALGVFLGDAPIVVFSFGVFMKPLCREFHATRATVGFALTIYSLLSGGIHPFLGCLLDRVGAKRIILAGTTLSALALISSEAVGSSIRQLYLIFVVLGLVGGATGPASYGVLIPRWFNRHRGLALSGMLFGIGIGAIIMPALAQRLIASFGWRAAYALTGSATLLICVPVVAAFLKDRPEEMGLTPDGDAAPGLQLRSSYEGHEWHEIWRDPLFWLMVAAFALIGLCVAGCVIHLPALLSDRGGRTTVATTVLGAALLLGRSGSGYFLDRFFAPRVVVCVFLGVSFGILLLWMGSSGPVALLAAFLIGLGLGAEGDVIGYLVSRYFGLRALGTSFGTAFGAHVLAAGLGVFLMGVGFDRTGSYTIPLGAAFFLTLLAVVLIGRLGPYRYGVLELNHPRTRLARESADSLA